MASAFTDQAKKQDSWLLKAAGGLIVGAGTTAGLTSVLLITFLCHTHISSPMAATG